MAETLKEYLVKVGFSADHASYQAAMEAVKRCAARLTRLQRILGRKLFPALCRRLTVCKRG